MYGCDGKGNDCFASSGALLLVYDTAKTVFGAATPYDGDTDTDKTKGAPYVGSGTSSNWEPPACSEAKQMCSQYPPVKGSAATVDNCSRQFGGQLGRKYTDSFSPQYGFPASESGTIRTEGILPQNFYNSNNAFLDIQKFYGKDGNLFNNGLLLPAPKEASTCKPAAGATPTCTCGLYSGPSYHNEVVIRTANPKTLYPGDSDAEKALRESYTKWHCNNQIPVAMAWAPGSNPTKHSWDASSDGEGTTHGDYIKAYQKQFQDICGPEYVPELVIFDYALAGGAPFKPLA